MTSFFLNVSYFAAIVNHGELCSRSSGSYTSYYQVSDSEQFLAVAPSVGEKKKSKCSAENIFYQQLW